MKKIILLSSIFLLLSSSVFSTKPRIAPHLSIWGKLIEQDNFSDRTYFKIFAEYLNGHKLNDTIEVYSEIPQIEFTKNTSTHFYFYYLKSNKGIWTLRMVESGFEKYKSENKFVHSNYLHFIEQNEFRLNIGWNTVFVPIKNVSNKVIDVNINDLRLLSSKAYVSDNSLLNLPMSDRVKNSEINNCPIKNYDKNIRIQPYLTKIFKMEIFIGEDFNLEKEYYKYKTISQKEIDTLFTNQKNLIVWGDISYKDELGIVQNYTEQPYRYGIVHGNLVICSDKNDYCKNRIIIY